MNILMNWGSHSEPHFSGHPYKSTSTEVLGAGRGGPIQGASP